MLYFHCLFLMLFGFHMITKNGDIEVSQMLDILDQQISISLLCSSIALSCEFCIQIKIFMNLGCLIINKTYIDVTVTQYLHIFYVFVTYAD